MQLVAWLEERVSLPALDTMSESSFRTRASEDQNGWPNWSYGLLALLCAEDDDYFSLAPRQFGLKSSAVIMT